MARQALMVRVIISMKAAGTATMHTFPTDLMTTMKTEVVRVAMPKNGDKNEDEDENEEEDVDDGNH